jgi:hypothetical protein
MKTTIINPRIRTINPPVPEFPNLYRSKCGCIVFATDAAGGVIIYSPADGGWRLGFQFSDASSTWQSVVNNGEWERLTGPVTIKFRP